MQVPGQRFVRTLTPGVRWLLGTWTLLWLLALVMRLLRLADISTWLLLTGTPVVHGQVWRLASYALLPQSLLDLVLSAILLVMFGGLLERVWTRGDFLLFALVCAIGAGLVKIALQPGATRALLGPGPVVFGFTGACARLFPHQMMMLPPSIEVRMRQLVILLAAASFFATAYMSGWVAAIIMVSGGGFGLAYLWLRSGWARPGSARPAVSQRINKLEL